MNRTAFITTARAAAFVFTVCLLSAPAHAQSNSDDLTKQLSKIQSELIEITQSLNPSEALESNEDAIRSLVKKSFQLQMQLQQMRIAKAELDLAKVKQQFAARMHAETSIIDARVAELTKTKSQTKIDGDDDVPASVLSAEGWKAWNKQDWRTALAKFNQAIEKGDTNANTLNGLGWTYLHLGEHEKAIYHFIKAQKIDPKHGGVLNGLGQSMMALGKFDEAKEILKQTVEDINEEMGEGVAVQRGVTAAWFALVRLHIQMKERQPAIALAKRYLKHKSDDKMMKQMLRQAEALETE
ncbi:MAG: tetratricopeptide repeat protein [Pirellulaceae bacterium]